MSVVIHLHRRGNFLPKRFFSPSSVNISPLVSDINQNLKRKWAHKIRRLHVPQTRNIPCLNHRCTSRDESTEWVTPCYLTLVNTYCWKQYFLIIKFCRKTNHRDHK